MGEKENAIGYDVAGCIAAELNWPQLTYIKLRHSVLYSLSLVQGVANILTVFNVES